MLLVILIVICVVLLIAQLRNKNKDYWKKRNIPQIDDLLWKFMLDNRSIPEICKTYYEQYDVPHIGTTMGTTTMLILKNAEDIQAVFAGDFQSFYKRGIPMNPNDTLADNLLFTDDYQKWKIFRQKLSPVFTSSKLKNMFYIIEKCARDFVEFVETDKLMRQTPFNVLYTYTTASIGASVFGIDTGTKNTMDSPFLEMAWKSLQPSIKTNLTFMISGMFPKLFKFLNLKFFGEHEDFFVGAVKKVLESRKHDTVTKRHDFIEICLELQRNGMMRDPSTGYELYPTDELLAAQAFFFFIAGADTTATAMHFTLLELSSNPKILDKLHNEIDTVFEPGKEELTYADTEKLQYLDMVINEAMRKYPPIGFIQRVCTKNTVLPSNVSIEKDVAVVIPVYAIHRDEKFYPNPDKFDPERFRPENTNNKFAYFPFGEGNRICIGKLIERFLLLISYRFTQESPIIV